MGKSLLKHTMEVYIKNFGLIMAAAIPGLFALLIPLVVGMPAYIALGGTYLRTGSIADLDSISFVAMSLAVIASLYLMSFAIVGINLVVKRQRTLKKLSRENLESIAKWTNSVFIMYLIATIVLLLIQIIIYENEWQRILAPVLNLIVGFAVLFLPTAMVMDEVRTFRAMQRGIKTIMKKPVLVLQWMIIALVLLSIVNLIFLILVDFISFIPRIIGQWAVVIFNSMIILPYLIVLLAQIYINKYTILVD